MTIKSEVTPLQSSPSWKLDCNNGRNILTLSGIWLAKNNNIPTIPDGYFRHAYDNQPLYFDTSSLKQWDSSLIVFLWSIKLQAAQSNIPFDQDSLPEAACKLLSLLSEKPAPVAKRAPYHFQPLVRVGDWFIQSLSDLGQAWMVFIETLKGITSIVAGKSYMRIVDLIQYIRDAGPSALIIISIVNFLVGSILGFVGAVQLRRFAADAYVANLVGIATVREMAVVMTAIVMSGRTGGAYAARIATMQGNEEIDSLKVMGIPISQYLILPSMLSLVFTMPFLYLYGCFMGILGGLTVSIIMLNVTVIGFLQQTFGAVEFNQFIFGGVKSIAFAIFIGISSCHIGLKAGRSAADVGVAATRAVVAGIVGVIALDAIFAVIADIIGI